MSPIYPPLELFLLLLALVFPTYHPTSLDGQLPTRLHTLASCTMSLLSEILLLPLRSVYVLVWGARRSFR